MSVTASNRTLGGAGNLSMEGRVVFLTGGLQILDAFRIALDPAEFKDAAGNEILRAVQWMVVDPAGQMGSWVFGSPVSMDAFVVAAGYSAGFANAQSWLPVGLMPPRSNGTHDPAPGTVRTWGAAGVGMIMQQSTSMTPAATAARFPKIVVIGDPAVAMGHMRALLEGQKPVPAIPANTVGLLAGTVLAFIKSIQRSMTNHEHMTQVRDTVVTDAKIVIQRDPSHRMLVEAFKEVSLRKLTSAGHLVVWIAAETDFGNKHFTSVPDAEDACISYAYILVGTKEYRQETGVAKRWWKVMRALHQAFGGSLNEEKWLDTDPVTDFVRQLQIVLEGIVALEPAGQPMTTQALFDFLDEHRGPQLSRMAGQVEVLDLLLFRVINRGLQKTWERKRAGIERMEALKKVAKAQAMSHVIETRQGGERASLLYLPLLGDIGAQINWAINASKEPRMVAPVVDDLPCTRCRRARDDNAEGDSAAMQLMIYDTMEIPREELRGTATTGFSLDPKYLEGLPAGKREVLKASVTHLKQVASNKNTPIVL